MLFPGMATCLDVAPGELPGSIPSDQTVGANTDSFKTLKSREPLVRYAPLRSC